MMSPYDPDKDPMRIDPDKPGLLQLLQGDGDPAMVLLARVGCTVLLFLYLTAVLSYVA